MHLEFDVEVNTRPYEIRNKKHFCSPQGYNLINVSSKVIDKLFIDDLNRRKAVIVKYEPSFNLLLVRAEILISDNHEMWKELNIMTFNAMTAAAST